ncbi:lachesin-like [Chelonus insularis]|uniref:lachesin-like n=1 Tax=Chelonus insularis TaxID=460826 RepID=UPI00158BD682|nr:lachesin-like [Chelonus insularis]
MFFVLLSITAAFISPITCLLLPEDGFSSDLESKLIRPKIYENTTTQIYADVGDSVQFECYASGSPGANITIEWSRPKYINVFQFSNITLPNGEKFYRGNILKFPSVKPEHAGSYDCTVYEEHTLPSSRSYLLSIKSKPIINQAIIKKVFKEKNVLYAIELSTQSEAIPEGDIAWYKDAQILNISDEYQISFYSGTSTLTILTENNDYHGTYKFVIKNEIGQTEHSFEI